MFLLVNQCASCAKPVDSTSPRCVRCHTRYCDSDCQHQHWVDGHKKKCKKIARGGGAEKHAAAQLLSETSATVAETRAAEVKGANCMLCNGVAVIRKGFAASGFDGLPDALIDRGCACGPQRFSHLACLMAHAKTHSEATDVATRTWDNWETCPSCEMPSVVTKRTVDRSRLIINPLGVRDSALKI